MQSLQSSLPIFSFLSLQSGAREHGFRKAAEVKEHGHLDSHAARVLAKQASK
jgi:hypothetical protein